MIINTMIKIINDAVAPIISMDYWHKLSVQPCAYKINDGLTSDSMLRKDDALLGDW